ncbi:hypothetical protein [Photobacterium leiognathi]|nr:hypothetical protein [Photobacterium leiognathi]
MEQSEYNAMCLEQVDNDGVTFEVNCPVCGYHVCDVDGCKRCEN